MSLQGDNASENLL